ncbi:hypothetical protein GCM10009603_42280 [Nocardiopsis exhalans]
MEPRLELLPVRELPTVPAMLPGPERPDRRMLPELIGWECTDMSLPAGSRREGLEENHWSVAPLPAEEGPEAGEGCGPEPGWLACWGTPKAGWGPEAADRGAGGPCFPGGAWAGWGQEGCWAAWGPEGCWYPGGRWGPEGPW